MFWPRRQPLATGQRTTSVWCGTPSTSIPFGTSPRYGFSSSARVGAGFVPAETIEYVGFFFVPPTLNR